MFFDGWFAGADTLGKKKRSERKNDLSYMLAFQTFAGDALRLRYRIDGLPDTCDERMIMQSLLWRGNILFVDYHDSLLSLPGSENGQPTVYGRFTSGYTMSLNGLFNRWVRLAIQGGDESDIVKKAMDMRKNGELDAVAVHESWIRFPFIYFCIYYAEAVADTMRTIDVARGHLKRPWIITAEESVIDTVRAYFKGVKDNDEVILSSGVFPVDKIQVLPLETTSASIQSATELVEWYEHRFRILCGLPGNAAVDKKGENLISDEISISTDYAMSQGEKLLSVLQEGLDLTNRRFGTHMTARRAVDYEKNEESDLSTDDREGRGDSVVPRGSSGKPTGNDL